MALFRRSSSVDGGGEEGSSASEQSPSRRDSAVSGASSTHEEGAYTLASDTSASPASDAVAGDSRRASLDSFEAALQARLEAALGGAPSPSNGGGGGGSPVGPRLHPKPTALRPASADGSGTLSEA
jgi:hypothetical protein